MRIIFHVALCLIDLRLFPCRVMDLLNQSDPSNVSLDEAKADQILSLTNSMLLLICSQTPLVKKLLKSCQFTHYFYCAQYIVTYSTSIST